jgi:hypothetical protein
MILEHHKDPDIFPGTALAFLAVPQLPLIGLIHRQQRPLKDRRRPGVKAPGFFNKAGR